MKPRRGLLLMCLSIALVSLAACGDGGGETADSSTTGGAEPSMSTTSTSSTTDDTGASGEGIPVTVYFARDEKVSPAGRSATSSDRVARDALTELIEGPDDQETAWGLGTAIPEDT
ncbi:MAG: hypothetical protein WBB46_12280, partial [Candidatus Deferrimicrobiaceae bacterium]